MEAIKKDTTVTSRVSSIMAKKARENLEKHGLSLSEFIRMAVYKAANDQVTYINFLDSPEALSAKKEAETGKLHHIGNLDDLDNWIDKL